MADFPTNTQWVQDDAISAAEGTAFLTVGGKNVVLFYLKSLEAKITKNKQDVRVVGRRGVGKKTTSWSGTGTLAMYEITSSFKELMLDYVNKGEDLYFSIQITNENPKYGREVKVLTGCNFDEITFAQLSDDDSLLEQELPFTFDGAELLEKYRNV